jgi:hypothetical protein
MALWRFLRRALRVLGVAALLLLLWSLPFGPLFPWSPWKPGYTRMTFSRADVFYPSGKELPPEFRQVDAYIAESEAFHRHTVPSRVRVILCRDWGAVRRYLPWLGGARVGGVTLATGTVIYITPIVEEKHLDPGEFIRHELSHATLNQHQTLLQAYRMRDAQPLFEGLAVSFGRQRAYVTREDFLDHARAHDLLSILDPRLRVSSGPGNMRLNYQAWRFFLEYLIETRGRDRFQALLDRSMADPIAYPSILSDVYGQNLAEMVQAFEADIRAGRWSGASAP